MRKLRFYLFGLLPGIIITLFILNKKGAGCSGYLPNSRVIAETLSKKFSYTDNFKSELSQLNLTETFLKDSIITKGEINFDKSNAQKIPCPNYILVYPENNPKYEVTYDKCKDSATFYSIKKLR